MNLQNSTLSFTKLPAGCRPRPAYDIRYFDGQWQWYGPEYGFLPRFVTSKQGSRNIVTREVSDTGVTSINRVHEYGLIHTSDIPLHLREGAMLTYLVDTRKNGEMVFDHANVGEKLFSEDGVCEYRVDMGVRYRFYREICDSYNIPVNPPTTYVEALLKQYKNHLSNRLDRDPIRFSREINRLETTIKDLETWLVNHA